MQSTELVSAFAEIAREKDVDRDTLQLILEDVFRSMIRKRYGADDSFEIIFNPDNGDIQIIHIQEVVQDMDVEDPVTQIELSDALAIEDDYEVEDEVASTIQIEDFGRRTIQMALQTFRQRIRDIEKDNIYKEYSELVGEIVVGEVYQMRRREVLVLHNKTELLLPREGQIYKDRYRKGDMLRAVVHEVERETGNAPQVKISRTAPVFIERLFELEVPEIYDGIVEIKRVEREPGDRAKVAVVSYDDRVDPVGACVGVKGSRIHAVVRELSNENIDVIPWTEDKIEFAKRSLAPAKPVAVEFNDELDPPRARVTVPSEEVSLAIGRGGQNIRLASRITGYEIDVYRDIAEDEEDVEIEEFRDVLPPDVIEQLKNIGCDTAKAVLELSAPELARRSGLTEEQTEKILLLMNAEFADEEADEPPSETEVAAEVTAEEPNAAGEPASAAETAAEEPAAEAGTETDEAADETEAPTGEAPPADADADLVEAGASEEAEAERTE
ncbi:MAG: transcription termination factor NusA [Bacteroidota bacterium]